MLRPWREDDAVPLQAWANDADVVRYVTWRFPYPYTLEDAANWISSNRDPTTAFNFAIEEKGAPVGSIGVQLGEQERSGSAVIGYVLGKPFWGRGLATDALRGITAYAFETFRLERLWANVMGPNAASARVLAKAGYVHEATLRRAIVDRWGGVHDELVFSKLGPSRQASGPR